MSSTKLYKLAYEAFKFYVDASDTELADQGMTRDDALYNARRYEQMIENQAPLVDIPVDLPIDVIAEAAIEADRREMTLSEYISHRLDLVLSEMKKSGALG